MIICFVLRASANGTSRPSAAFVFVSPLGCKTYVSSVIVISRRVDSATQCFTTIRGICNVQCLLVLVSRWMPLEAQIFCFHGWHTSLTWICAHYEGSACDAITSSMAPCVSGSTWRVVCDLKWVRAQHNLHAHPESFLFELACRAWEELIVLMSAYAK